MPATRTRRQAAAQALKAHVAADRRRFEAGAAGDLWHRLSVLDVINQAMVLAATLLLCGIPLLLFLDAVRDQSFVVSFAHRLGLNEEASAELRALFTSDPPAVSAVTVGSLVILTLYALWVASVVQALYARVFGFEPRDLPQFWRRPAWVVVTVAGTSAVAAVSAALGPAWHGPVFARAASTVVATAYFWWSLHFLLERRLSWRYLLPSAVATGLCWLGLTLFSAAYFSSAMISGSQRYGPIGVVFVIMTWLIAVGVVLTLGAVLGVVWRERHPLGKAAS